MAEMTKYPNGAFCWADLGTTDARDAKRFYTQLFGWEAVDTPAGDGMTYVMLQLKGKHVAALYQMGPQQKSAPPTWYCYVKMDSADDVARRAAELGGKTVMPPMDVMDAGRMTMVQDPTGAFLSAWQPRKHQGAALMNEPGALCWFELMTPDADKATSFYKKLFGWTTKTMPLGASTYTTWHLGEEGIGGMMPMEGSKFAGVPPHWSPYFAVTDCEASVAKVQKLGGKVHVPTTPIPDMGRFAVLADPQGASFSIFESKR